MLLLPLCMVEGTGHTEWKNRNLCLEGKHCQALYNVCGTWNFFNGVFLMKVLEFEKVIACLMVHCSFGVFVLIFQTFN